MAKNFSLLFLILNHLYSFGSSTPSYIWADSLKNPAYSFTVNKHLRDMLFWELSCTFVGAADKAINTNSPIVAHRYSLWELAPSLGKESVIVLIDTGIHSPNKSDQLYIQKHQINLLNNVCSPTSLIGQHGTHLYGLIAGQFDYIGLMPKVSVKKRIGLAPRAKVIMIRAFGSDGTAQLSTLIKALQIAQEQCHADVVCLGLKIGDDESSIGPLKETFESLLKGIPFVVAAAGNDGDPNELCYVGRKVAYPGCLSCVSLSVGAIGSGMHTVPSFSQVGKKIGPTVLAPGVAIASSVYFNEEEKRMAYLFMDGTSCAAAFVAGFMGLVISEFRQDFTKDQLLGVIYASCCISHDQLVGKSTYGILDMRVAMFTLHVLRYIKKSLSCIYFMSHFNSIVSFSLEIIRNSPYPYKDINCSLSDMIQFVSDIVLNRISIKGIKIPKNFT